MSPLLLASASPRRRELLEQLGIEFTTTATDLDETPLPGESPRQLVNRLACAKARTASVKADPGQWILGADTVVALGQEILGKPVSAADADTMLQRLSGRSHRVYTGIALLQAPLRQSPATDAAPPMPNDPTAEPPGPSCKPDGAPAETLYTRVICTKVCMRTIHASERHRYIATGEPMGKAGAYAIQGRATAFIRYIVGSYTNVVGLPLYELAALWEEKACGAEARD